MRTASVAQLRGGMTRAPSILKTRRGQGVSDMAGTMLQATQKKKDFQMMLACSTHLGTKNLDFQMTRYVWKRKTDGIHIINLGRTYDKLLLAARIAQPALLAACTRR